METRRCMNCMEELLENNIICPACGADNGKIEQLAYALKCGFILHERYLIGRVLGQGGFGITYIGMDLLLNVKVAIKEYFPMGLVARDPADSSKLLWNPSQASQSQRQSGYDSFLKEARKMAKIDEIPSIVRVRDLFLENETAYIVMDFVEGITLKQKLQQEGPMPFSECFALLRPMMEDLVKVHKQGMIHRDISPDNIMIRKDGKVRLLDLGAAKDMTAAHGVSSQVVAKNGFSPFEQYMNNGNIGTWTDVYALCATIYYCITGKLLPEALKRIEEEEEISFSDNLKEPLSEKVKEAMLSGLEVRVKKRTQSVEELMGHFASVEPMLKPEIEPWQKKETKEQKKVTEARPTPIQRLKQQQTYMPAMMPDVLSKKFSNEDSAVLGNSSVKRSEIYKITFLSTLSNMLANAWDVSARRDGSVMAWTVSVKDGGYHLYIGGEGGIRAPQTCRTLFSGYSQMTEINFNGCFDTTGVTDMGYMFNDCKKLMHLDLRNFVTDRVIDMRMMFFGCENLHQLDLGDFDTSQATDMKWMFAGCETLSELDLSKFDTSRVTNMWKMFGDCRNLNKLDLRNFDTSHVTDMRGMFWGCDNLNELDLRNFDTSHVTDMRGMFWGCDNLNELDLKSFDTSQVTNMSDMFWGCDNLGVLDLKNFDTSQVTNMSGMFCRCDSLRELNLRNFNMGRVTDTSDMFLGCPAKVTGL